MDELEILQPPCAYAAVWPRPANVHMLQTTRHGGCSRAPYGSLNLGLHVGDRRADVVCNRTRVERRFGLPATPRFLDQVHGNDVVNLDALASNSVPEADAAVTFVPGVVGAILTADCLPLLFTTTCGDRVAAAHGGWRGLTGGVIEATLAALDADPGEVMVWIGPGIGPARYRVDETVIAAAVRRHPGADRFATAVATDEWCFDLGAYAEAILRLAGVVSITRCPTCTSTDTRFFSHRRDGDTGRMATLIWRDDVTA